MKKTDISRLIRKGLTCILLLCIAAASAICTAESLPDYYSVGLEVTSTLNEMLQNRNYLEMFLTAESILNIAETELNTGDYDQPTAVYRLEQKDPREWILRMIPESDQEKLNALSPTLQEQIWIRMEGASYAANIINARKGTEIIALSNVLQVILEKPELETEKPEYLLFIFEKGTPVLVTCGHHTATGMILALDPAETESAETIQAALQSCGFEVTPYDAR